MNNAKQAPKKGFIHTKTFRFSLLAIVLVVVGGFVYNLVVDSPEAVVSTEEAENPNVAAPDYDNLDVVGDYLWPTLKENRDDSIARVKADEEAKRKAEEAENARKNTVPEPAKHSESDEVIDEGSSESQPQIVPSVPQRNLPAVATSKVEHVQAPKVESVGND